MPALSRSLAERIKRPEQPKLPHVLLKARAGSGKTATQIVGVAWAFGGDLWPEIQERIAIHKNAKDIRLGKLPSLNPETFRFTPSIEQQVVWDELKKSADSGARTITYTAFNKSIVNEFSEDWGWLVKLLSKRGIDLRFATINALGNRVLYETFGKLQVTDDRTKDILSRLLGRDVRRTFRKDPADVALFSAVNELIGLAKLTMAGWDGERLNLDDITPSVLYDLASQYDICLSEGTDISQQVFELVPKVLEKSLLVNGDRTIDFDDQNWLPVVLSLPINKADLLLADEVQDFSRVKQEYAIRAGRRILAVGDDRQACYAFAGADTESMNRLEKILTIDKPLMLTQTRRCGKIIVEKARSIVPDFQAAEDNEEGLVGDLHFTNLDKYNQPIMVAGKIREVYRDRLLDKDMVICRVNAPLVSEVMKLLKDGRKAIIRGRDVGQQIAKFVQSLKARDIPDLQGRLEAWYERERSKEMARYNPNDAKLIAIDDKKQMIEAMSAECATVDEVIVKINLIFAGKECPHCHKHYSEDLDTCPFSYCKTERDPVTGYPIGPKLVKPEGVLYSSIHRAKGLEADRVFFLMPPNAPCPHPMAKSDSQKGQEMNLLYIGITRAKSELYFVR